MNKNAKKAAIILSGLMKDYARENNPLDLCVSDGNEKIGRIKNVSVAPILTCKGVCNTCVNHCYDLKAVLQYPGTAKARARNTVILRNDPFEFFVQLLHAAQRQRKNLFRLNVGGEIDSLAHLQIIVRVAAMVPKTKFLLFTKKHFLVNSYVETCGKLPSNLKLIFSTWPGMTVDNPHNFPLSCPYPEKLPHGWKKCIGNCELCAQYKCGCWDVEKGRIIGFKYHGNESGEFAAQWDGKEVAV